MTTLSIVKIHYDSANHLHQDNGPAIEWSDGHGSYYYHGILLGHSFQGFTLQDHQSESIRQANLIPIIQFLIV